MPYAYEHPRPAVACDLCVFAVVDGRLSLLLVRRRNEPFKGRWALPGGFMNMDERLVEAARRELEEETGVACPEAPRFVGVYDAPDRDPRGRVLSAVYRFLFREAPPRLAAGDDATDARWHEVDALPSLAFDHDRIVSDALTALREE